MLGQNICNYAHPSDKPHVRKALIPDNLEQLFEHTSPTGAAAAAAAGHHHNRHNGNGNGNSGSAGGDPTSSDQARTSAREAAKARVAAIEKQLRDDRRRFTFRWVFARAPSVSNGPTHVRPLR